MMGDRDAEPPHPADGQVNLTGSTRRNTPARRMFPSGSRTYIERQRHHRWSTVVTSSPRDRRRSSSVGKSLLSISSAKSMEGRSLEPDRLPGILGERDGQGLVEQPDDLSVAAVAVADLEEGDAVELPQDVEPDDLHVEALDRLEITDAEDRLSQGFHSRIHLTRVLEAGRCRGPWATSGRPAEGKACALTSSPRASCRPSWAW